MIIEDFLYKSPDDIRLLVKRCPRFLFQRPPVEGGSERRQRKGQRQKVIDNDNEYRDIY